MHTIFLVWKHCKFYNTPGRLVVLVREICNDRQAASFVSGEQLFGMVQQLKLVLDQLKVRLDLGLRLSFESLHWEVPTLVGGEQ